MLKLLHYVSFILIIAHVHIIKSITYSYFAQQIKLLRLSHCISIIALSMCTFPYFTQKSPDIITVSLPRWSNLQLDTTLCFLFPCKYCNSNKMLLIMEATKTFTEITIILLITIKFNLVISFPKFDFVMKYLFSAYNTNLVNPGLTYFQKCCNLNIGTIYQTIIHN